MGKSNILSGNVEFVLCVRSRAQIETLGIYVSLHFIKDLFLKMSHPERLLVHLCAEKSSYFTVRQLHHKSTCTLPYSRECSRPAERGYSPLTFETAMARRHISCYKHESLSL